MGDIRVRARSSANNLSLAGSMIGVHDGHIANST